MKHQISNKATNTASISLTNSAQENWYKKIIGGVASVVIALSVASCNQSGNIKEDEKATEGFQGVDDLYIVDCLLPGQVRNLGSMKYLAARRPIRTTAVDCRIRGGEYVAYDRADYRSALKVWLPQAEAGNAEAQNYVGEIFEKGLGQEPDYKSAIAWYQKAADQGYSRAQINLGYMYEKGIGVDKSITTALNLYRKASGLKDDELVLGSEARKEIEAARVELTTQLNNSKVQTQYLQKQIAALKEDVEKQQALAQQNSGSSSQEDEYELIAARQQIAALSQLYEKAVAERDEVAGQLESMEVAYRKYSDQDFLSPPDIGGTQSLVYKDIDFGRYYAIIIGNQDYIFLDDLRSPLRDSARIKEILEEKYGFSTLLIPNATEKSILNTINEFYDQIGENDNLLIYYAGHGNISRSDQSRTERGYWLPVDAAKENISNWINNSVISDHLDRLKARSVLVISDSCYAGQLGSDKSPFLFGVSSSNESERLIKAGLSRRSRVVISSGGVKPVLDGSNRTHSVFASALIDALEQNDKTMRDSGLFSQLAVNVRKRSAFSAFNEEPQIPEMKPVREAGHEGGTFYFVPKN